MLTDDELKFLDKIRKVYRKEPKQTIENRYETFCALFTYNSNAVEGNTLTLQETSQLLFENILPRKSLREVNEALNHKMAFDLLFEFKGDVTKKFICNLHKTVVKNTLKPELEPYIGKYRTLRVYIRGVEWLPPKPNEVNKEMKSLLFWYSINKKKLHPLILTAYFHVGFESIHPFVDGNGRVGRLLMNFILHKNGYPMVNILNNEKYKYYDALEEARVRNNLRPFLEFLLDLLKSSKIYF